MTVDLVEVVRSGFVEGVHRGSVVALDAQGGVVVKVGEPDAPHLPRSANKPLQLVGMLRAGLDLPPPDLAVAASSHSGEPAHVGRVRDLLHRRSLPRARWPARRRCRSARRRRGSCWRPAAARPARS